MLLAFPIVLVAFFAGHWLVAAAMGRSLFRSPSLWTASLTKRLLTWVAGPALCYVIAAVCAFPSQRSQSEPTLTVDVVPGMPAAAAGVHSGDRLVRIGSVSLKRWDEVIPAVQATRGQTVTVEVDRNGSTLLLPVVNDGKLGVQTRLAQASVPGAAGKALTTPARVWSASWRRLSPSLRELRPGQRPVPYPSCARPPSAAELASASSRRCCSPRRSPSCSLWTASRS